MEEFSKNCGFILTCNYGNKIIDPLKSRCSEIKFTIKKTEMGKLASEFMKRACWILDEEKIPYEKAVVAEVIKKYYPDWRKTLNELQRYAATGKIDSGILSNFEESNLKDLMNLVKAKNFTGVRKWVGQNIDNDADVMYRRIYDAASTYFTKSTNPHAVLIIGKYQYQHAFVADAEINLMCCLTELMVEGEFV